MNPQHPGSAATFLSADGKPVLLLSFSFGLDRGHAHGGRVKPWRWIIAFRLSHDLIKARLLHVRSALLVTSNWAVGE
ncbi:hypothetical protein ACOI1H_25100 [Loktanella sp. DJP18]|uniref:hypothetical protein n=1 Tax=Loktanella sp. DJP18 TaxID=3409788 RepID=UPI003BB5EB1B